MQSSSAVDFGRTEHAVVIAGGGPTGLMLAAELALAGVEVAIVERRTSQVVDGARAGGLHARSLEVLDQRGIVERFLEAGRVMQTQWFAGIPVSISDFPTRHNHGLALWQGHIERLLADWVGELGVTIYRGRDVAGFAQDATGVQVHVAGQAALHARYLVGCDGGRSLVRKAAGIEFVGVPPSKSWILAEVEMSEPPTLGVRPEGGGIGPVNPEIGGGPYRVVLTEPELEHPGEPSMEELVSVLHDVYGTDFGAHSPTWITRFTDMTRQAAQYRLGRVLLAGDAAHVHPPQGGQGLNTGLQDAVNLGWKLAQVVHGSSPESLLDTYHSERHPVAARVLDNTRAQVALSGSDPGHQALRAMMTELLSLDEPRRRVAAMLSALDVHYDLGDTHPLLGRRMPDLSLQLAGERRRVYSLLHEARPVLLNLAEPGALAVQECSERVMQVDAHTSDNWDLPLLGAVPAPSAVLIRPDGHVAWVGEGTDAGLRDALARWCGAPARSTSP